MSDEDLKTQTLIKYGDVYAQIYSDQQTNKILAVRFLDANTLATLQPYKQIEQKMRDKLVKVPTIKFLMNKTLIN